MKGFATLVLVVWLVVCAAMALFDPDTSPLVWALAGAVGIALMVLASFIATQAHDRRDRD